MRLGTKVESNKLTAKCVMMNDIVSRTRNLNFLALGPPQARLIIENSKYVAPVFFFFLELTNFSEACRGSQI